MGGVGRQPSLQGCHCRWHQEESRRHMQTQRPLIFPQTRGHLQLSSTCHLAPLPCSNTNSHQGPPLEIRMVSRWRRSRSKLKWPEGLAAFPWRRKGPSTRSRKTQESWLQDPKSWKSWQLISRVTSL
ncbi:hypothetical protein mRhiFer1_010278 [Rhinolophus ferrumequinum]|uniref:Uncharacterized protein n=1 Tax=Rhinolophus ferrumequinum TaxID=59479 RepID=A0A7J7X5T2_RHIFE|nr:hypothetical protein mRhiFer1_010278 [Rhinolophus ferrumequinum]